MCLTINENSKVKTAKKDIVVYKIIKKINDKYETVFRDSPINLGESYKSDLIINNLTYEINIEIGLHSFKTIKDVFTAIPRYYKFSYKMCLVKCIIPKGSKYFNGKFIFFQSSVDSYASDNITYTNEIIYVWD